MYRIAIKFQTMAVGYNPSVPPITPVFQLIASFTTAINYCKH